MAKFWSSTEKSDDTSMAWDRDVYFNTDSFWTVIIQNLIFLQFVLLEIQLKIL